MNKKPKYINKCIKQCVNTYIHACKQINKYAKTENMIWLLISENYNFLNLILSLNLTQASLFWDSPP